MMLRTTWPLFMGALIAMQGGSKAQECGVAPLNTRIVGGEDALAGWWPWQVSIHYTTFHVCGGTLISEDWVLSAAHCILNTSASPWTLYFGRQNQSGPNPNEVSRSVAQVIVHPDYENGTFQNDIALFKLSSPVTYTNYIRPVCMASNTSQFHNATMCWATGWGRLGSDQPNVAFERLQEVEIPVIGNKQCACSYSLVPHDITSNMLCAGEEGRGICQGDSGGPLQCKQGSRWIQAGITSFGIPCANKGFPEVFARVSFYQDWITEQVSGANISFLSHTATGTDADSSFVCEFLEDSATKASLSCLSLLLLLLFIQAL
ncbi:chymotrypsin-like protease CTRL-1 [Dunckerocampus dactyliophorus]|uniref:chymotrypsin-like protease CTRL-1 n=1 Tax=Dunckerocampus dactyliophorus TaxID=161453 RepID=UPI002406521E|nr:chymotrypsin-like protease CTRL-1 [Dunckerocampus dactyliophorus]